MNKILLIILSLFVFNSSFATVYYSQVSVGGGTDVTQLSNWKTSVGGGVSPSSFLAGDEFHIVNADSMDASLAWNITGAKLVIESGKFRNSGFSHHFTLDMAAGAYYYHTGGSYNYVLFGSLAPTSTFEYWGGTFYSSKIYPNLVVNTSNSFAVDGNLVVQGSLTIKNAGNFVFSYTTNSTVTIANDFNMKGGIVVAAYAPYNNTLTIGGDLNVTGGTLLISQSSGKGVVNISGNINLSSGSLYLCRSSGRVTVSVSGSFNMTGGIFVGKDSGSTSNASLSLLGSCTISGGSFYPTNGTGNGKFTLVLAGSGNMSINSTGANLLNMTVSGSYTLATDLLIGKTLWINGGNLMISNYTLTLNDSLNVTSGTLTGGANSNLILQSTVSNVNLPAITLKSLTVNKSARTVSMTGNVTIGYSLTLTAGTLSIGSNTLIFNGTLFPGSGVLLGGASSNVTLSGTTTTNFPSVSLNDFSINKTISSAVVTLTGPVTVFNSLNLTNGTLSNSTQPLTIASGATIFRNTGTLTSIPTFTNLYLLVYNGSTAVTTGNELYISTPNKLEWLTINNTAGVTLGKNVKVNQNLTINSGGVFNAASFTIEEDANWINNGTFNPGTGKVNFYGNTTISGTPSGGHNFYNVEIGAGSTLTAPLAASLNVSNNFITDDVTSIFNHNNGTINFTSSGSQTIPALNYYNLTSTNTGGRILPTSGTIGIAGIFTKGTNTYTITSSTVNFNGTSAQNIPGFTFNNLSVSGNNVKSLSGADIIVKGLLSFGNAVISTGANKVIMGAVGSVTGGGSGNYVNGNLQKNFAIGSGVSRTFEVGNSSNYLPITATFASVTSAGNITASTTDGDHPQIASSCIDASKSVNRYWTLSNSGVSPSSYDVILGFTASDIDPGASFVNFEGAVYNGSNWQNMTSGSKTSSSIALTGATSFGSFQIGESNTLVSVSINANPGTSICPGASVTFTATPVNGGTNPTYSWNKNGTPVGSNSDTYIDAALTIGDAITVDIVSNSPCAFNPNATSNTLTMTNSGGCSYTWTGAVSSIWSTASNWNSGIVPDSTDDVTIPSGTPFNPDVTGSVKVRDLIMNTSAVLNLSSSGSLSIFGNFTNNGTFIDNGATTVFKGSSNQTLTGATTFSNLTLNGSGGLNLASATTVNGILSLIKGTLTSGGNLTVDLNTGAVAYNTTDIGSVSGNMQVKKTVTGVGTHDIATPLSGTTANDLNDDTPVRNGSGTRLYTWNGNTASYTGIFNLATPLTVGTGYALYCTGTSTALDLTGTYNHSASAYSITASHADSVNILVGNPYPSALDWYAVSGWTKTNIDDIVAYYDGANTRYAYFLNGISLSGGTQYIPALNSFWVKRSSTGSATIGLDNQTRITSQNPSMWRKATLVNYLKVTAGAGNRSDEALIRFDEQATDLYDKSLDGFKLINPDGTPSVYTSDGGTNYSINSLPAKDKVISLNVKPGFSGLHTIVVEGIESFDIPCLVILEDKLLNVRKEIKGTTTYNCTINEGDKADRFNLRVAYTMNNSSINSKVLIGSYDKTINLTFNNAGNFASVNVYNIVGQQLTTLDNVNIESGIYSINDAKLSEGLYVVKVSVGNEIYTGKVYIK